MADELDMSKVVAQDGDDEPIVWEGDKKDDDDVLARKIGVRVSEAETLWSKKLKEWNEAEAYFDGRPDRVDQKQEPMHYNPLFPLLRNMTGLTTDPKPHPSVKLVADTKDMQQDEKEELLELGDKLERSLEDWWETEQMQTELQKIVLSEYLLSDLFVMPYWSMEKDDVCVYPLSPKRVKIDPNCDKASEAEYAVVDFYRSRRQMYAQFGKEKIQKLNIKFADHFIEQDVPEVGKAGEAEQSGVRMYKNVCKLELYMEKEWWCYRVGNKVIERLRCPFWVPEDAVQREGMGNKIRERYESERRGGLGGVVDKAVDTVKGVMGMETENSRMEQEISMALSTFKPKANYIPFAKIPLVHFETNRLVNELYSRPLFKQAKPILDDINARKNALAQNAKEHGNPGIAIDGNMYNESDALRIKDARRTGDVIRFNTSGGKSMEQSIKILQGSAMPSQYIDDMYQAKRDLDTLYGNHEVSRGLGDPSSKTKGGIIALQEADQVPVRLLSRVIENNLQEIFNWVIQIRKIFKNETVLIGEETVDYSLVDGRLKVFIKSGSMFPVSKEQQRAQAIELFNAGGLDPLTLYERIGDPDPEKTAKRLEMWLKTKSILVDSGLEDQQNRVIDKLKLIQAGRFDEIQVLPDDDPRIHHDMLLMALKSGQLAPQAEEKVAELIAQYTELAKQGSAQPGAPAPGPAGTTVIPANAPPATV